MNGRRLEPGEPGRDAPFPQNREGTSTKEKHRRAGTPATLEGNIDNDIDKANDTGNWAALQAYPVRWLVSRYSVSAAVAAFIAKELGMEGAQ